jgi:hypothetical protein
MKFNFRKIASVLASVVMLGSTLGIAAAANYPAPFVVGGSADGAIVVTSGEHVGAISDWESAVSTQTALQALVTASSSGSTAVATGGDSYNLGVGSSKIYYNTSINTNKATLTKSELPTVLADGKVIDDTGSEYTYQQQVVVGSKKIEYSTSEGDLDDPALLIQVGDPSVVTDASNLYQVKVNFNKEINLSSGDVQGNTIKILGKEFTIGSSSTNATLYLFGAGNSKTIKEGETATVDIGNTTYTITVSAVTQTSNINYVSLSVNGGETRKIAESASSKVGDLEVYAKSVVYSAKESTTNYAELSIGSKTIKLGHASTVKQGSGSDETSIQGTYVNLTQGSAGKVNGLIVSVGLQKSTKDYIKAGDSFTDPVFGGLKVQFSDMTPALDAATRDSIAVDTDNSKNVRATFTTALSSTEYSFNFAHDQSGTAGTVLPRLATSANKTIHVVEGENLRLNELAVLNKDDRGCIVRLDDMSVSGSATDYVTFVNAITGASDKVELGTDEQADASICGASYKVNATSTTAQVTWGAGAGYGSVGTQTAVFPRIKLQSGEWLAILGSTSVAKTGAYALPGVEDLATYEAQTTTLNWGVGSTNSTTVGNLAYNVVWGAGAANETGTLQALSTPSCNFSATYGPAVLLIEEKKSNDNNGDAICIPLTTTGTTAEIAVGTSVATGVWSGLTSLTSDTYKSRAITKYGSFIERDTSSGTNNKVAVKYPDSEMYANVLVTSPEAVVTPGQGGGAGGQITVVKDTEVSTVKDKNLLVIGGSCINSVARAIVDPNATASICGADFTAKTMVGAGQYLIKAVASPYNPAKVAVLVAGWEAADTKNAVAKLKEGATTAVGTSNVYPVAAA